MSISISSNTTQNGLFLYSQGCLCYDCKNEVVRICDLYKAKNPLVLPRGSYSDEREKQGDEPTHTQLESDELTHYCLAAFGEVCEHTISQSIAFLSL